ncbi:MAG: magnesium transporter [Thermotogae bacterium]|nr:magnesium transporter [Thermotogota bacterium]
MKVTMKIDIRKFIEANQLRTLKSILEDQDAATIIDMIDELPVEEKLIVFRLLPKELAAQVFSELDPTDQTKLLSLFKEERVRDILNYMDPDDRTDLFDELPANVVKKLLEYLSPEERKRAIELLNYPPNSAGRLMTPEFVDLKEHLTVEEALEHVRKTGKDKETVYVLFVIDKTRKLKGTVELKDLIFADPGIKISEIMDPDPLYVHTTDDQEEVARFMSDHDLIAVPVVDSEQRLVGVITIDDIVDIIEEEATEDIQKMANMGVSYESYFHTKTTRFFKNRVFWLIALLIFESFSGVIITKYQDFLRTFAVLAAFIPTMIATGGNAATQTSALIIRAMATGEIELRDWWRVLLKELWVSVLLGASLAVVMMVRAHFTSPVLDVTLGVSCALLVMVVFSGVTGALLPFFARLLKIDPAFMAGPVVATIMDVMGVAIYFYVVSMFIK